MLDTEITIYITPPPNPDYGWAVSCDGCEYDERMLTEEGADILAKGHKKAHTVRIER